MIKLIDSFSENVAKRRVQKRLKKSNKCMDCDLSKKKCSECNMCLTLKTENYPDFKKEFKKMIYLTGKIHDRRKKDMPVKIEKRRKVNIGTEVW